MFAQHDRAANENELGDRVRRAFNQLRKTLSRSNVRSEIIQVIGFRPEHI